MRDEMFSSTGALSLRSVLETIQAVMPHVEIVRAGGAGYKFMSVFEGEADAYIHDGPIRQWDVCAGSMLLQAQGGRVSDWLGAEHRYCLPHGSAASVGGTDAKRQENGDLADGPTVAAASVSKKKAFAVRGIIAAASQELHRDLLRVVQGALGVAPHKEATATANSAAV
ncbi:hypothetical protein EON62_02420 [archaeon]|nr:MAG: hypothetical protein EON62_02420 [archaeon]